MSTTIVLADDHTVVRQGIRKLLETRDDFRIVGEASDGEEAVKLVTEKKPDVALMDLWMPRLSGIDATRRIGKRGLATKVLVLSMHESRAYVEEVLRAGAAGYIVKNAAADDLIEAIDTVRDGVSYLSPSSKEIAAMLGVSLKTIDSHRSNLMEKLDIHKVSGLVRFAIRTGLVEP